ncbi:MAG: hypothetical protein IRZ30_12670 [Sphaerobacter sp.]|nr:hypothetical protein [Sphaerobacter sp.]
MVPNPRAETRADQLRPLNRPRPARILTEQGRPAVVIEGQRRYRVTQVRDAWRIDDEWWRNPISRRYYQLVLDNGSLRTVYHDLITDTWYEQGY